MSPKSRGRRKNAGKKGKRPSGPPRQVRMSDHMLRSAHEIAGIDDPLIAEMWGSRWLGNAWYSADLGEREPERQLCMEIVGRASTKPTPHGIAAVCALLRTAPPGEHKLLTETIDILAETQPLPSWHTSGPWTATGAWRAVDVWDSERVLFVDYGGPHPHTLMAQIVEPGGTFVEKIGILRPGAAEHWEKLRGPGEVPMPVEAVPVEEVLADLADALRLTDMTWPRNGDDAYIEHRALAWVRSRDHLPPLGDYQSLPDDERDRLLAAFTAEHPGQDVELTRSLAETFLEYGDGHITTGPLAWSPVWVELFLLDYLPRKVILDAEHRDHLPDTLKSWVAFALRERGVEPRWITPVIDAVTALAADFREAFDSGEGWGPAKQIAAELAARGVDFGDKDALNDAMRELNAERLAQRLTEGDL